MHKLQKIPNNKKMKQHQKPHRNPKCKQCKTTMRKKGKIKIGEARYKCPNCGNEAGHQKNHWHKK